MIGRKRLEKYGMDDGALLVQYVQRFDRILTTQHVLAETSNLCRQIIKGQHLSDFSTKLYPLFCSEMPESFQQCPVDGNRIDRGIFGRLGLTDSGLAYLVQTNLLLLTDDLDLFVAAVERGQDAINFTHMRDAAGLL
jgi:hypothetical protein